MAKRIVQFEVQVEGDAEFHESDFEYTVANALIRRYPQFDVSTKLTRWAEAPKEEDDGITEEVTPDDGTEVSGGAGSPSGPSESSLEGPLGDPETGRPVGSE